MYYSNTNICIALQVLHTRFNNSTVWAYKGLGWSLVASIVEKIISRTNSNAVRKIAKEGDFRPFYYPNKEIYQPTA